MRVLEAHEIEQISGGAPKWEKISEDQRAEPGADVTPNKPGNRTGWCRGFGNVKDGTPKHECTECFELQV